MKKNREQTEQKIYEAFLLLLKQKGPKGVGINAIAKKADVSKQLIYRYFGGLKGLLLKYAQTGDFFEPLFILEQKERSSVADLKQFVKEGTKELRENKAAQEILRWQLLENNPETKELFKYTNAALAKIFAINNNDTTLNQALQLMIGGYTYFTLLSKFNKTFIATDLTKAETWEKFDKTLEKTIELFNKNDNR